MDFLIDVSTPNASGVLVPLLEALKRRGCKWAIFFTNDGVETLADARVQSLMHLASEAVACEYSWERFHKGKPCPVAIGSQTDHSKLAAHAARIVSL